MLVSRGALGNIDGHNATVGADFKVNEIVDTIDPVRQVHDPGNPEANEDGFIWLSNVNEVTEMVEMVAASRSFQNNVEVVNTAKQLVMRTLDITKA